MNLVRPLPPPYDALVWEKLPYPEKCRLVCQAWALQGYGTPMAVFIVYALKVGAYIAAWCLFTSFTPGLGDPRRIVEWWAQPIAFQKAIIWSLMFESLGFGCGSGPLTGRYFPPLGGATYFLRPGTTKRAWLGGHRRTWLDVTLYAALQLSLLRALIAPTLGMSELLPIVVLIPLLSVFDTTLFLAARGEHYYFTILCFAFAPQWIAGAKAVQLALWFWAGVSKLNHHFPAVVCVMISNSPVVQWSRARRWMYRDYPTDLRPSRLAVVLAHIGTAFELGIPIVLGLSAGGTGTAVGIVMMFLLHGFITSSVPMGVPIEWNFMVVYGALFLFGAHADVSVFDAGSLAVLVALAIGLVVVPLAGHLFPRYVSFLLAMRYYAGNWAYGVWLFRGDSYRKLEKLTKTSPWIHDQLSRFYDRRTAVGLVGKVLGFRAMHLHGRALQLLLPRAVPDVAEYEYVDGELVAGLVLGWNFGDGHLHDERLLHAIQAQCGFEPGELRVVMVESQPLFRPRLAWRIHDAHDGPMDQGTIEVRRLLELQPWPAS